MKQPLSANRAYRIANQAQTELLCGRAIEDFVRRKLFISELRNEPISRAGAQETQAFTDFQERSQFSQLSAAPAGHHPLRPPELRNEPISRAEAPETQAYTDFQERTQFSPFFSRPAGRRRPRFAPFLHPFAHLPHPLNVQS